MTDIIIIVLIILSVLHVEKMISVVVSNQKEIAEHLERIENEK